MIITVLAVFGLVLGSFINALVWRLRQQAVAKGHETGGKRKNKNPQVSRLKSQNSYLKSRYSILKGRSVCVNCGHRLSIKDLVPVLSWIMLRGKCRYCGKPISVQYPLVEAATAVLFIISYIFWPLELTGAEIPAFIIWLAMLTGLIALAVYDIRWMILPNKIIFPLLGLTVASVLIRTADTYSLEPLTSAFLGALVGGGIFYILFQISGGKWIGGGDVKLGFLLGIIVGGATEAFLLLFIASLLGSVFSIPLIIKNRLGSKSRIAFGPFLITAAIIVQLFGTRLIEWYQNLLML